MEVVITGKKTAKEGIIAIGQSLINKAEEITKDIDKDKVSSITIYANLNPNEIVTFEVSKSYYAQFEEENNEISNE